MNTRRPKLRIAVFHPGKLQRRNPSKKIRKPSLVQGSKNNLAKVGSLIPFQKLNPSVRGMLQFAKHDFSSREHILSAMREGIARLGKYTLYKPYALLIKEQIHICRPWIRCEQRVRTRFRNLIRIWILKRYKNRRLNTEDPVTLAVPEKPVNVFDVRLRGSYVFDLETIKKVLEEDLVYSEWMFPKTRQPKNPFTNLPFTCAQLIELIKSINNYGTSSWILEGYKTSHYNTDKFLRNYSIPIQLHGLNSIIRNKTSDEFQEFLTEFIEDSYDYHQIQFTSHLNILKWAVIHAANDPYMKRWISLFKKYHEHSILYGKYDQSKYDYLDATQELLEDSANLARLGRERLAPPSRTSASVQSPILTSRIVLTGVVLSGGVIQRIVNIPNTTLLQASTFYSDEDELV
jgi:hypothetical protein